MELSELRVEQFKPLVGQTFQFTVPGHPASYSFTLIDASNSKYAGHRRDARHPFSLLFRGPEQMVLPQAVYTVEHPDVGAMTIMVVPIIVAEDGRLMQAVFN